MGWTINDIPLESLNITLAGWSEESLNVSVLDLDMAVMDFSADVPAVLAYGNLITLKDDNDVQVFIGKVDSPRRVASGSSESMRYSVLDAMDDLDNELYRQDRNYVQSITTVNDNETSIIQYQPQESGLVMWEADVPLGERIRDVVNYAASRGVQISVGNIPDGVDAYRVQYDDASCGDLIRSMMTLMPEYVFYINNRTTPPTANMVLRSAMPALNYDINSGDVMLSCDVKSHERDQVNGVEIRYEKPLSLDGNNATGMVVDSAGVTTGLKVATYTVPLTGASASYEYQKIVTRPVPQADAAEVDILKWYIEQVPQLAKIKQLKSESALLAVLKVSSEDDLEKGLFKHALKVVPAVHDDVPPINPNATPVRQSTDPADYSRQLIDGSLPEWSGKRAREVAVTATLGIQKSTFNAIQDAEIKALLEELFTDEKTIASVEYLTAQVDGSFTGTNAQTRTYKRNLTADLGESPPTGLAAQMLAQFSPLRHSGSLSLKGREVDTNPRPGRRLNLTNGRAAWSGMNEAIQGVSYDVQRGVVSVSFGPPQQLGPGDLKDRLRSFRKNGFSHGLRADKPNTDGVGGIVATAKNNIQLSKPSGVASTVDLPWKATVSKDDNDNTQLAVLGGYISRGITDTDPFKVLDKLVTTGDKAWLNITSSSGTDVDAAEIMVGSSWPSPMVTPLDVSSPDSMLEVNVILAEVKVENDIDVLIQYENANFSLRYVAVSQGIILYPR